MRDDKCLGLDHYQEQQQNQDTFLKPLHQGIILISSCWIRKQELSHKCEGKALWCSGLLHRVEVRTQFSDNTIKKHYRPLAQHLRPKGSSPILQNSHNVFLNVSRMLNL